jgi:hypothetical protein
MVDMTPDDSDFLSEFAKSLFGEDADRLLAEYTGTKMDLLDFFGVRQLEEDLELPTGFFEDLAHEDDWSFVIKLHALIEAALTHLLVETIARPSLHDIFSRIDTSNVQTGKLAFADKLGLVSTDVKRFIRTLSELRNSFVHDVSNVKVDLTSFVKRLPPGKRKGLYKAFGWGLPDRELRIKADQDLYDSRGLMKLFAFATFPHAPKLSIWFGAMLCLNDVSRHVSLARLDTEQRQLLKDVITRLASMQQGAETDSKTGAYALRGEPVKYIDPFGSVAEDDWNATS